MHGWVGVCVKSRLLYRCIQLLSRNASLWIRASRCGGYFCFTGEISTKQSAGPSGIFLCAYLFVRRHMCMHVCKHVQADFHLLPTPEGKNIPPYSQIWHKHGDRSYFPCCCFSFFWKWHEIVDVMKETAVEKILHTNKIKCYFERNFNIRRYQLLYFGHLWFKIFSSFLFRWAETLKLTSDTDAVTQGKRRRSLMQT